LFQGSRRGTDGRLLSSMIVSSEPTAPSRLRSDQGRRGILSPVAGLLLKTTCRTAANGPTPHGSGAALRLTVIMTVRRPCKPLVVAARCARGYRCKLVPEFSDDAAALRRAEVACLALASRAGEVS